MKTPREILFRRHQSAEPKLDEIREKVVATVCDRHMRNSPAAADRHYNLREFVFSFRWHLAGMGTTWLVIVLLNLNVGHSANVASVAPSGNIPPPQIILASLRENRRELLEMIQPAESRDARLPKSYPIQPRSERRDEILTA